MYGYRPSLEVVHITYAHILMTITLRYATSN